MHVSKKPFLIGVTGGTASGKTTVCEMIIDEIQKNPDVADASVKILSQDLFYRELTDDQIELAYAGRFNFDHPQAFDFDLFKKTVELLLSGKPSVEVPIYCYKTHSRIGMQVFENADVIMVEGILSFYHRGIRELFDMKFFVDCDADTRLARRISRDVESRGRTIENVITQYVEFVKPAFEEFCLPTKRHADIILPKGKENLVAINLIAQHIHDLLTGSIIHPVVKTHISSSIPSHEDLEFKKRSNSDCATKSRPH